LVQTVIVVSKPVPAENKHRINRDIRFPQIRVIGADGEQLGLMSPDEARQKAQAVGLDLVEVAADARPPVCKIMDYGKFKYESGKKMKPQKSSKLKTIQIGTKISDHDLGIKLAHARAFLGEGDKVRFLMRMKGRENAFAEKLASELYQKLTVLEDAGKMASRPSFEGRVIVCQFDPK
jgi:translation initiation factor IF-3